MEDMFNTMIAFYALGMICVLIGLVFMLVMNMVLFGGACLLFGAIIATVAVGMHAVFDAVWIDEEFQEEEEA